MNPITIHADAPFATGNSSTSSPLEDIESSHQEIIACLNSVLEGNYQIRLNSNDPLSQVVNKLITKLESETVSTMDRIVQLSINASETTMCAAHMMSALREMDQRSQSMASGAQQMQGSIQNINHYGSEISKEVLDTQKTVCKSADAATQTMLTMADITTAVEDTLNKIKVLESFSNEIASVAETIKGIAFQTNLLSLNANVEAAKAGDAGRGFAVVAKEVGILARRSGEATKAIDEMVKNTQQEITDIVDSMHKSSDAVNKGQKAITTLDGSMQEVKQTVNRVQESTAQISRNLEEQNTAVKLVSSGIQDIVGATTSSVSGIENIVHSMQEVERVVDKALASLGEKEVKNKVLKLAQSDHVNWKKRLINMVVGLEGLSSYELSDHNSCRLGKWYNQVRDAELKNNDAFAYLVKPHQEVHECGKRAVDLFNRGKVEEALAEIQNVERASEEVLDILVYLDQQNS